MKKLLATTLFLGFTFPAWAGSDECQKYNQVQYMKYKPTYCEDLLPAKKRKGLKSPTPRMVPMAPPPEPCNPFNPFCTVPELFGKILGEVDDEPATMRLGSAPGRGIATAPQGLLAATLALPGALLQETGNLAKRVTSNPSRAERP